MKNHYETLGLEEGASQEAIQEAYERLSKELNPADNDNQEFFIEEYELLKEAYFALTNNPNVLLYKSKQKQPIPTKNNHITKKYNFFSLKTTIILLFLIIGLHIFGISNKEAVDSNDVDSTTIDTTTEALAPYEVDDSTSTFTNSIEYFETPENGFSPYDDYFGQGVYDDSTNNEFVIENSNQNDVIVCLVDYNTEIKIRNEFIRKGSTFNMTGVPNGTYYLAWFSGNNWSPYLPMNKNFVGGFQTDANFSKSDSASDLMECEGDMRWTITLYSVENGNMNQTEMSEVEFFK